MVTTLEYGAFLKTKMALNPSAGVEVALDAIHPALYPFQRQLVQWALRKGRCALFADTGLGKTLMQLEWARLTDERCLVLAPLAVAQQTIREAERVGLALSYAKTQADAKSTGITITNYERMDAFDISAFGAVVLDESSILKSEDGKTRGKLIEVCQRVKYRLACTATPAPNDIAEFANHAEFLGVATRQEMLSMFFVHDDEGWRMKGHAIEPFYRWMATWAMLLKRPSDIGFEDDGFILPPLNIMPRLVSGDAVALAQAQGQLMPMGLKGIAGRSAARKATLSQKIEQAAQLLNASKQQWVVWHVTNDEGYELVKVVSDAVLVEGADSLDDKVDRINAFIEGKARVLVTKTKIAGFGLNLQRCHNMLFLGLTDSWESYYQAIRRCWRFGQTQPVNVQIVLSDLEQPILENVMRKEQQANEISGAMVAQVSQYERAELGMLNVSKNGYHETTQRGKDWTLMLGDCVERLRDVPDASVDLSVFSPPFMSLYVYSNSERDMGNSKSEQEFFGHFGYLIKELLRVTKPGRIVACHVSQVGATLNHDGFIGIKDFRGKTIQALIDGGFIFQGEVCIDKDPQAQAIRTHSKALLFVQLKKDASWLRPGLADYILVFRAPGENAEAIHPDINNDEWIEWARPIWYGIRESDTLNVAEGRTEQDERHICALQLGTIERCIRLWSNKGETVLSPFAGIGSEGYEAVKLERRFIGIELKPEYFETACRNLERATQSKTQLALPLAP